MHESEEERDTESRRRGRTELLNRLAICRSNWSMVCICYCLLRQPVSRLRDNGQYLIEAAAVAALVTLRRFAFVTWEGLFKTTKTYEIRCVSDVMTNLIGFDGNGP